MDAYDVAIAGGGPAGASAAIELARAGARVLLAEATPTRAGKIGEGLPASSRSLLRDLQVLDRVTHGVHRASYGTVSSWGSPALHANDVVYGLHGHGWQLDRATFDAALRDAAAEAGARVETNARLSLRERDASGAVVDLRTPHDSRPLRCRWLIDAGGRAAVLSRRFGAQRDTYDALLAFHCRFSAPAHDDRDGSTLVEAVEDGWWYSVLLPSRERLVVFLTDDDGDHRRWLGLDGFVGALARTRHLAELCARHGYVPAGSPHGADASSALLDRASGDGWLAVGDAAASFDPLSSRGIATALYTGQLGARAVAAALAGDTEPIAQYRLQITAVFQTYRRQLADVYASERRWPYAPFWRRRHVGSARVAATADMRI